MRVEIPVGLQLVFGTSVLCCQKACISGFVIGVFDDSDKVRGDVVLFREVYEDMAEVLLVLEMFLTKDS